MSCTSSSSMVIEPSASSKKKVILRRGKKNSSSSSSSISIKKKGSKRHPTEKEEDKHGEKEDEVESESEGEEEEGEEGGGEEEEEKKEKRSVSKTKRVKKEKKVFVYSPATLPLYQVRCGIPPFQGPGASTLPSSVLATILSNAIVCQEATSKHKPSVYLSATQAVKGPFLVSKAKKGKSKDILFRWPLMEQRMVFFDRICQSFVQQHLLVEEGNNQRYWLVSDRVVDSTQVTSFTSCSASQVSDVCNGVSARIIEKSSVGHLRVQDVCNQKNSRDYWINHPELCAKIWCALAARYIAEPCIGDSGLWNLLIAEGEIYQVDFEEIRANVDTKPASWVDCLVAKRIHPDFVHACKLHFPELVSGKGSKVDKKKAVKESLLAKEWSDIREAIDHMEEELGRKEDRKYNLNRIAWLEELSHL